MARGSRRYLFNLLFITTLLIGFVSRQVHADSDCDELLANATSVAQGLTSSLMAGAESKSARESVAVLTERRSLLELFDPNPETNLAVQRPFMVMNAAERLLALVYSQGVKRIRVPGLAREVNYYPAFSDGLAVTNYARVVGQYEAIEKIMAGIRAQAVGDRSGNSPLLALGPKGTGKTELLSVVRALYLNLTSSYDSPFATYKVYWTNLHKIPSLRAFVIIRNRGGVETSDPRPSYMNDGPLAILPEGMHQQVVALVEPHARKLTLGLGPNPYTKPDPQSQFIRDEILKFYSTQVYKREMTSMEMLAVLNNHVELGRIVIGAGPGTLPTIEYQGNEIDTRGLFMAPDPALRMEYGPTHPMAWFLNGQVLGAHGNAAFYDEVAKNPEEFLKMLLGIFESRVIQIGGTPRAPFDAAIITATNQADVDKLSTDSGQAALLDRFEKVAMLYPRRPHEILDTLLYMKSASLYGRPLDDPTSEGKKLTAKQLFPMPIPDQPVQGPDGHYVLWYQNGNVRVEISPHALLFLAEIVGATRLITDIKGNELALANYKMVNEPVFRDPIARLRFLEGISSRLPSAQISEFEEIISIVKEGHTGISSRDAGRWLKDVLDRAASPEHDFTVTPDLVLAVFKERLNGDEITAPSKETRLHWRQLSVRVSNELLIPRLKEDVMKAIGSNSAELDAAYTDVLDELTELEEDPSAVSIRVEGGRQKVIDKKRLESVRAIFQKNEGRPLVAGAILRHGRQRGSAAPDKNVRHPGLMTAVTQYYAGLETARRSSSISDLYRYAANGEGNEEVRESYDNYLNGMARLGYNRYAAIQALAISNQQSIESTRVR